MGFIEKRFIFFPEGRLEGDPGHWGLSFEDAYSPASDGVMLHGWFVPGQRRVTWLWCHGNAGNISHRLENLLLIHHHLEVSVFLFDYRGYGLSQGTPTEQGTYRDAVAALEYLHSRNDMDSRHIVYFGRSLGAAVAVDLAVHRPPLGLILESPFASARDMARLAFPLLPLHLLVRRKYDTLSKIDKVSCPLLLIHGERDEIVPPSQGLKLYERANEPKNLSVIPGTGHNDLYQTGGNSYWAALSDFMKSL